MRKLLILFISIVFVSCSQQTSNIDKAEWSGSISENDNKTQIIKMLKYQLMMTLFHLMRWLKDLHQDMKNLITLRIQM